MTYEKDFLESDEDDNPLLNLFAKFDLTLGRIADQLDKQILQEQRRFSALPNYIALERMSVLSAGGTDVVSFGGPQGGRVWLVRLLGAVSSPLVVSGPPVVTWYVGQNMPGPAAGQLPSTMARWQFAAVPAFQNFTADVIQVKAGQQLLAGITGAPASTALSLIASVNDQPMYAGAPVIIE